MRANRKARILTAALLVVVVGVGLARRSGWRVSGVRISRLPRASATPPEPQDAIHAMLNAARAGSVKEYLDAYTDPMEAALRKTISESSEAAFAKYLVDSAASIKGVALSDPEEVSETQARVRVEYIYADRNEAQTMYLEKLRGGWKIARTDAGERIPTLIPYGTPVTASPPAPRPQ